MDKLYEQYKIASQERNRRIVAGRKVGMSLAQLAVAFGISQQRVSAICKTMRQQKAASK
jgi:DNA-directed RNA polymerase specialized sigma subunit